MPSEFDSLERRRTDRELSDLDRLFSMMRQVSDDLTTIKQALAEHVKREEGGLKALRESMDELSQFHLAFPHDGGKPDLIGHRMTHENLKQSEDELRELKKEGRKAVVEQAVKWGFGLLQVGFMAWLALHLGGSHGL